MKRILLLGTMLMVGCDGLGNLSSPPLDSHEKWGDSEVEIVAEANFQDSKAVTAYHLLASKPEWINLAPSDYQLAVKDFSLLSATGKEVSLLSKKQLADSLLLAFSPNAFKVPLISSSLPLDVYVGARLSVYFVQMTLPINGKNQAVRCYLSDDDFSSEKAFGLGPHHQGDLMLLDEQGDEIGWIAGGDFAAQQDRPVPKSGENLFASNPDPETGHDRGPFGNDEHWKNHPASKPYTIMLPLSQLKLEQGDRKRIALRMDVSTAWSYVDMDGSGTFNPAGGADAQSEEAGWGPVLPKLGLEVVL